MVASVEINFDHVTPLLCDLHWQKSLEQVDFKLIITIYKSLQDLVDSIQRIADTRRRHRRSSSTETLVVPYPRLITAGDRAFSLSGSWLWNSIPYDTTFIYSFFFSLACSSLWTWTTLNKLNSNKLNLTLQATEHSLVKLHEYITRLCCQHRIVNLCQLRENETDSGGLGRPMRHNA